MPIILEITRLQGDKTMKTTILNVKGMLCPSCEHLIKESLEELKGVKSAAASLKMNQVVVEFDESKISEKDIKEAIRKEGYKV